MEAGLKHARLPIDEYIQLKSRKVLTVNNIVEIITQYVDLKDWKAAFVNSIPSRKVDGSVVSDESLTVVNSTVNGVEHAIIAV